MSRTSSVPVARRLGVAIPILVASAVAAALFLSSPVSADGPCEPPKGAVPAAPAGPAPAPAAANATPAKTFASKEEAAKALVEAAEKNDDAALNALAGSAGADVVQDGKDPQVAKDRAAFAAAAKKKMRFEEKDDEVTIVVGDEDWPFPVPLVKDGDKWSFDVEEGRTEILARRIGRNELRAIKICREFVEAQVEYASKDRDGDKVREYAQRLMSTPGTQDGLYWPTKPGEDPSPLSDELAPFKDYFSGAQGAPFGGYVWRLLTRQGPNAPGGDYGYVINGNMIGGFALIGVPAEYRNTAVMTLMVSHHGTILQKDLGADTLRVAAGIASFDPDSTWKEVPSDDLVASTTADK